MIKCDYALPKHLADSLILAIQQSHFVKQGDFFAIPRKNISALNSYFLSFTRDAISGAAEGDGGPAYALDMILGQIPGGASSVTLLGTLVKSSTSIIIQVDQDGLGVEEGLNREQTFSKAMLHQAGMLMYRTHDASLVRHQVTRNPWQLLGGGGGGGDPGLRTLPSRKRATPTPGRIRLIS